MKRVTFKKLIAYKGVAGAFNFLGVECIIVAKTGKDVGLIRSMIAPLAIPNPAEFKNVVLTSAEHLQSAK